MTGVEILSTQEIYNGIIPEGWLLLAVPLFIVGTILGIISACEDNIGLASIFIVCAVCGVVLCGLTAKSDESNLAYIEYKVTISDEVSMNEFYKKYEVVDQEGKIYTVRERENE